jgi:hypothetical protein
VLSFVSDACALPVRAVDIDGSMDPSECKDGGYITDLRKTKPLCGKPQQLRTEPWILAMRWCLRRFRCEQPASVPLTR